MRWPWQKKPEPTTKDHLIAARKLVEANWCKGASAKDKSGRPVIASNPAAASFCLIGAIEKVTSPYEVDGTRDVSHVVEEVLRDRLRTEIGTGLIAPFNDHPKTTKDDVLALLDRTIETAA